jgi:hypothetical protein
MDFGQLLHIAETIVPTGMLPEHIKNAAQACAIMLTGQEMGMTPMRAIRSLQMVKGKVIESADSMLARFKSDGGRGQFVVLNEERAELALIHPNGDQHTEVFTIEDAKRAGLLGGSGMYQKFPKAMLRSRAITAGLKSLGWEGSAGAFDPSEFPDDTATTATITNVAPVTSRFADEEPLTLEDALGVELLGKEGSFNGNAGKELAFVPASMLIRARAYFQKKYDEKLADGGVHETRLARQMEAIDLVLPWRQEQDGKQDAEIVRATSGVAGETMHGGLVQNALPRNDRAAQGEG